MDLRTFLRDPIFVDETTGLDEISQRLKKEEHPYVFLKNAGNIFSLKSFNFFLEKQESYERTLERSVSEPPLKIISYADLTLHVLDVLAELVTLVQYEDSLKYLLREDFLLTMMSTAANSEIAWLRVLFSSIPRGLMVVDINYGVVNSNAEAHRMLRISEAELPDLRMQDLLGLNNFQYVYNTQTSLLNQFITTPSSQAAILVDFVPLVMYQVVTGFALVLQDLPSVEVIAMELDSVKLLNNDLEAILSTIYDEIIVVDARGKLLRASDHYISSQWNRPPNTLIGHQLLKLKKADELLHKVIREVQKKKRKVSLMQNDDESHRLSVGNPIFHKSGEIERIVIASRDLTEVSRLQSELEQTRKQSENYRAELERMRERVTEAQGILPIYASPQMHEVMQEVERVAQFSATVLLSGESGVGKEIIANDRGDYNGNSDL